MAVKWRRVRRKINESSNKEKENNTRIDTNPDQAKEQ